MPYNYVPGPEYKAPPHMVRHTAEIVSVCDRQSLSDEQKVLACRRANAELLAEVFPSLSPEAQARAMATIANLKRG